MRTQRPVAVVWAIVTCVATAGAVFGQADVAPRLTQPTEKLAIKQGFRDWLGISVSGATVVSGSPNGARGGLWAFDTTTGKLKWEFRPSAPIEKYVSEPAVIDGGVAVAAFGAEESGAFIAVSMATGKEVWRRANPARGAGPAASGGVFYLFTADGALSAVDTAGTVKWTVPFGTLNRLRTTPVVRDGALYFLASTDQAVSARDRSSFFVFALDAATGTEKWRYRRATDDVEPLVVTGDTVYAVSSVPGSFFRLTAVNRQSGQERWAPIELSYMGTRGFKENEHVRHLIEAGPYVVGVSALGLRAFEKATGRVAWSVATEGQEEPTPLAVVGNVLYVGGTSSEPSARWQRGTMYAMDVTSQKVLWSFARAGALESKWSFGRVLPINDGLWATAFGALVKLQ